MGGWFDSIGQTNRSEEPIRKDTKKGIRGCNHSDNYSFINVDYLFDIRDLWSFLSDDTFLVRDKNGDSYFVYFDLENWIFEIDNYSSFLAQLESFFSISSYWNSASKRKNHYYISLHA